MDPAPPQPPPQPPPDKPSGRGPVAKAFIVAAILLPIAAFLTCNPGSGAGAQGEWAAVELVVGLVLLAASLVAGLVVLMFTILGPNRSLPGLAFLVNVGVTIATVASAFSHFSYTRGRQLRGPRGRVLPTRKPEPLPVEIRRRAARAWRNNGDTEAASVSAFALLSLDLAQLGAPLALTRAAHEDALDEIRHAELCYGLARDFGDPDAGLTPMPGLSAVRTRACTPARVAVESFVEGAYLEAVSAEIARALIPAVAAGPARAALEVIAADEARHADHAWMVLAWCLGRDPATVRDALRRARDEIPVPDPRRDEPGSDGSLEHAGIPGRDLQRTIAERVLAESKDQLERLLSGLAAAA